LNIGASPAACSPVNGEIARGGQHGCPPTGSSTGTDCFDMRLGWQVPAGSTTAVAVTAGTSDLTLV
jgi:hypothetical protein